MLYKRNGTKSDKKFKMKPVRIRINLSSELENNFRAATAHN